MAAARWFGNVIIVLVIALLLFAGMYWFFPDQYQRIFVQSQQDVPEVLTKTVDSLEHSLRDTGLTGDEVREVWNR